MKRIILLMIGTFVYMHTANAMYLDSKVFTLESGKNYYSRRVYNDTENSNLYTINVSRISKPGNNEEYQPIENGEVLYTPLKKILQPHEYDFFKIYYRGPQDNRERYYRIVIKETPVKVFTNDFSRGKYPLILPVTSLSTIMVVRPREIQYSYHYDPESEILENTGNTYFTVLIHRGCNDSDDDAKMFNLLPGETYHGSDLKGEHKKFIIGFEHFERLGQQCFSE